MNTCVNAVSQVVDHSLRHADPALAHSRSASDASTASELLAAEPLATLNRRDAARVGQGREPLRRRVDRPRSARDDEVLGVRRELAGLLDRAALGVAQRDARPGTAPAGCRLRRSARAVSRTTADGDRHPVRSAGMRRACSVPPILTTAPAAATSSSTAPEPASIAAGTAAYVAPPRESSTISAISHAGRSHWRRRIATRNPIAASRPSASKRRDPVISKASKREQPDERTRLGCRCGQQWPRSVVDQHADDPWRRDRRRDGDRRERARHRRPVPTESDEEGDSADQEEQRRLRVGEDDEAGGHARCHHAPAVASHEHPMRQPQGDDGKKQPWRSGQAAAHRHPLEGPRHEGEGNRRGPRRRSASEESPSEQEEGRNREDGCGNRDRPHHVHPEPAVQRGTEVEAERRIGVRSVQSVVGRRFRQAPATSPGGRGSSGRRGRRR